MNYKRVIYWSSADEQWIAEVPDIPGCKAFGKTPSEAFDNTDKLIASAVGATGSKKASSN